MKNCPNCFRANNNEAECCNKCGTPFQIWKYAEPIPESGQNSYLEKNAGLSDSTLTRLLIIIVIIIAVGFFLLWLFAAAASSGLSDG